MQSLKHIKVIAFDADDTMWVNEPYFREIEERFASLLEDFLPRHVIDKELYRIEMQNLPIYGYGIKAFMLSMIESAMYITDNKISAQHIKKIIGFGKEMLNKPVELLEGVVDVLEAVKGKYKLVVATKGDLLDQERKLKKSGLEAYFHHIEIMSDKKDADYIKLIKHLDIQSSEFLMLGNSLKSDILPVLNIGGYAIHIPYHTTWIHEHVDHEINHPNFQTAHHISDILSFL